MWVKDGYTHSKTTHSCSLIKAGQSGETAPRVSNVESIKITPLFFADCLIDGEVFF